MYHPFWENCIDYIDYSVRLTQNYEYNIFTVFITTWFVDLYGHHQVVLQINKKKCISGRGLPFKNKIYDMTYFINCSWVATRWQYYSTHLHTNNTQNDTKQTIHRTTQNKQYTEQHKTNNTQNNTKQTIYRTTQNKQYTEQHKTNNTQNNTKQTIRRTTQNKQYAERHKTNNTQNDTKQTNHRTTQKQTIHRATQEYWKFSAGRAPSLRVLLWHLPYN
jgi:hypothetical protein